MSRADVSTVSCSQGQRGRRGVVIMQALQGKWLLHTFLDSALRKNQHFMSGIKWKTYGLSWDHTVSTANSEGDRQCVSFLIILHYYHFIKFVPVTLILEILWERVLFVTLILVLKKLAEKEISSEFRIPQVTVVPYFSMLLICTLFSE